MNEFDAKRMADGVSFELLNDSIDQSSITIGGIRLASCNELDIKTLPDGTMQVDPDQQKKIHDIIRWTAFVISDFMNGHYILTPPWVDPSNVLSNVLKKSNNG